MDIPYMISIVECYIHIRKNKEVRLKYPKDIHELSLLIKAYDYAINWMKINNVSINKI